MPISYCVPYSDASGFLPSNDSFVDVIIQTLLSYTFQVSDHYISRDLKNAPALIYTEIFVQVRKRENGGFEDIVVLRTHDLSTLC